MVRRAGLVLALPAATLLVGLSAAPAMAADFPTTPVPSPASPGQPPASASNGPQPLGHAVADAATGLAVLRLLPGAVPANSILPGAANQLPRNSAAELGFGLSSAQANSESFLDFERAIAQSAPGGVAIEGNSPQLPGALSQTALPDNPKPITGGLNPPSTPLDALVKVGVLNGQVHARWSPTVGPCVGTIADASTSLASVSALNLIPSLPSTTNPAALTKALSQSKLTAAQKQALIDNLSHMAGPLSSLAGLLSGGVTTGGGGSLLSLPNTLSSRSTVRLVNIPGSANKAVQSISTMQVASVKLLAGTPLEVDLDVVSQPTLTVTSTGSAKTSTISYTAPVIRIVQGGKTLQTLDAAHPKADVPIGIPLNVPNLPKLPIVGDLLPNGQQLTSGIPVIDIGVLRLRIAELDKSSQALTGGVNGAPFTGFQLGATARMLDLQVLPTAALGMPNLPAALAQLSLGEQVARAYAPAGGVRCGSTTGVSNPTRPHAPPGAPKTLAFTNAAYHTVPLFWLGTGMLMAGVILVASLPRRREH
ncbi:MAG TPA: hypothetical protein VJX10_17210 [Pseudonocardiaceae bacterium]|nr:hypothetical protein [Pseudonocardiaceae bacterium]